MQPSFTLCQISFAEGACNIIYHAVPIAAIIKHLTNILQSTQSPEVWEGI